MKEEIVDLSSPAGEHHIAHLHMRMLSPKAFNLRMPDGLWDHLRECAAGNGRSLNAEIVFRLRRSCEGYRKL